MRRCRRHGCNSRDTAGRHERPALRPGGIDAAPTTTNPRCGVVDHIRIRPTGRIPGMARAQESRSMIRQTGLQSTETDVEDRSMRLVEYVMAFVAVVVAGVL